MAKLVGEVGGASKQAFKFSSKGVIARQEDSVDPMMALGGDIAVPKSGKFTDKNHPCLQPTSVDQMYPVNPDKNMLVRRNHDEYPQYEKDAEG